MGKTSIQWTDYVQNCWEGCSKVSPGCKNCYAAVRDARHMIEDVGHWGPGALRRRTSSANWKLPLRWNRAAQQANEKHQAQFEAESEAYDGASFTALPRPRVFCGSLMDWLDDEVPIEWLADLLDLIRRTPNLDWLLLTKRPQNFFDRLRRVIPQFDNRPSEIPYSPEEQAYRFVVNWVEGHAPPNVWIGTSVEDQQRADKRIPELLKIPAKVRFLSIEPLISAVDLLPLIYDLQRKSISISSGTRLVYDQPGRNDLEKYRIQGRGDSVYSADNTKESRCEQIQQTGLSQGDVSRRGKTDSGCGTSGSLDDVQQSGYSCRDGNQSQERGEVGQHANEPRNAHEGGQCSPCDQNIREETEGAERRDERDGKGNGSPSAGDQNPVFDEINDPEGNRIKIRADAKCGVGNRSRKKLGIHHVIVGCESGPNRRPMDISWARSLRDQCKAAGVPFFLKQLSSFGKVFHDLDQFPEDLRIREFPRA